MHERTFTRGEVTVTTKTPARATQLVAEGWTEIHDWPTERPEPGHRFETERGQIIGTVTASDNATGPHVAVESKSVGRRRRAETSETPPTDTTE
ncbi:MAG TPA: hypothetical protein VK611_26920 [Acidimicrobiales bacterium]|nr:hypothetical protein [Acidimicrobiales bacterium]